TFYVRGFEAIAASMRGELQEKSFEEVSEISFFRVLVEVAFSVIFWAGITATWVILVNQGMLKFASGIELISSEKVGPVKILPPSEVVAVAGPMREAGARPAQPAQPEQTRLAPDVSLDI